MRWSTALVLAVFASLALAACGGGSDGGDGSRATAPTGFDGPAPEPADVPAPAPEIPKNAPTVVFLGDSIAAGLHLAEHQAFPSILQRRLAARDRPFRLVSSCESGRTTAGGVTALDWVMRSEPEVVVVQLGGNDGLRGIELAEVEANLRAIIERTIAGDARVLLLGVRLPPNYGEYGAAFDALYPMLAEEYEIAFVPFFMNGVGAVPEMNLEDGLHPTAEGQEKLADNVEGALGKVLREFRMP